MAGCIIIGTLAAAATDATGGAAAATGSAAATGGILATADESTALGSERDRLTAAPCFRPDSCCQKASKELSRICEKYC